MRSFQGMEVYLSLRAATSTRFVAWHLFCPTVQLVPPHALR